MNIDGCSAIVTGGASGMGAATAHKLARMGAKVSVWDIDSVKLQNIAEQNNILGIECDVTSEDSVSAALARVTAEHGSPQVCVNCAGIIVASRITSRQGPMPLEVFKKCININLVGTFNVMRLVVDQMIGNVPQESDGERGVIVNTASIAAFEGQIGQVAYSASKGGVAAMTLPAARELAKFGVRVVSVAPGLIETPMLTNLADDVYEELVSSTVFPKRLGKAEEFAHLIMHIIENLLINGEIIRLDGAVRLTTK